MYFIRPACICSVVTAFIFFTSPCFALGEWPDGPHKEWFENLRRPDNHLHPERNVDPKSQYCCGAADVVRTRFKVEMAGGEYPEDSWYAWLNNSWTKIPPEKIVEGHAPNGQPYLFCSPARYSASCGPRAAFEPWRTRGISASSGGDVLPHRRSSGS